MNAETRESNQVRPAGAQSFEKGPAWLPVKPEIENLDGILCGYGSGDDLQLKRFKANELLERTHAAKIGTGFYKKNAHYKITFQ
jgi:hypothetical protein